MTTKLRMNKMHLKLQKYDEHDFAAFPPFEKYADTKSGFQIYKDSHPKRPVGHGKGHSSPPRLKAISKKTENIIVHRFSAKHCVGTASGTTKKLDMFKLP